MPAESYLVSRAKQVLKRQSPYMRKLNHFVGQATLQVRTDQSVALDLWQKNQPLAVPPMVNQALTHAGIQQLQIEVVNPDQIALPNVEDNLRDGLRHLAIHGAPEGQTLNFGPVRLTATPAKLNPKKAAVAKQIIQHIPKTNYLSLNFFRGLLADIVMQDKAMIPKFKELTTKLLTWDKEGLSRKEQAKKLQLETQKQFPPENRKNLSWLLRIGFFVGDYLPLVFLISFNLLLKQTAKLFIAGENMVEAKETIAKLQKQKAGYVIDFVAEEANTVEIADRNITSYLAAMDSLPPNSEQVISIKLTGLVPNFTPAKGQRVTPENIQAAKDALKTLISKARQKGVLIVIDMERYIVKDATLDILEAVHRETNYQSVGNLGIVLQTYLKSSLEDTIRLSRFAVECQDQPSSEGTLFVRFVKGAYPDKDRQYVLPDHESVNKRFIDCLRMAFSQDGALRVAIASHNIRTISEAFCEARLFGIDPKNLEFEMLLGMPAGPMLLALAQMGNKIRFYLPVGSFEESLGYFMRRMDENSSSTSCQKLFRQYQGGEFSLNEFLGRAFMPVPVEA